MPTPPAGDFREIDVEKHFPPLHGRPGHPAVSSCKNRRSMKRIFASSSPYAVTAVSRCLSVSCRSKPPANLRPVYPRHPDVKRKVRRRCRFFISDRRSGRYLVAPLSGLRRDEPSPSIPKPYGSCNQLGHAAFENMSVVKLVLGKKRAKLLARTR